MTNLNPNPLKCNEAARPPNPKVSALRAVVNKHKAVTGRTYTYNYKNGRFKVKIWAMPTNEQAVWTALHAEARKLGAMLNYKHVDPYTGRYSFIAIWESQ